MDWEADAQQLHQLARELYSQTPQVEVRISRQLADKAVADFSAACRQGGSGLAA
jgi:hypothetical protein